MTYSDSKMKIDSTQHSVDVDATKLDRDRRKFPTPSRRRRPSFQPSAQILQHPGRSARPSFLSCPSRRLGQSLQIPSPSLRQFLDQLRNSRRLRVESQRRQWPHLALKDARQTFLAAPSRPRGAPTLRRLLWLSLALVTLVGSGAGESISEPFSEAAESSALTLQRKTRSSDENSKDDFYWNLKRTPSNAVPPIAADQSQPEIPRLAQSPSRARRGLHRNTRLTSPMRTSPFGFPRRKEGKTVTDFLVNKKLQLEKSPTAEKPSKQTEAANYAKTSDVNLSKYFKKKLRRQKQEERLYFKIKKFVVRECKQESESQLPRRLKSRSISNDRRTERDNGVGNERRSKALRRHIRKRHKMATAMQCDFKIKQIMHQLKRGKLVYMYSLAAYPDRYLRLFHEDVRNCFLTSTFPSIGGASNSRGENEVQTKDNFQPEFPMSPKATKHLQRCLERKIRHKATSLTDLGRMLVDLRSIFIGLCTGTFRRCNQDFGILVEAPIRSLYEKYGQKLRLLGEQIRDILLGCGRSPDFYHCTYASLKEYSSAYKRRKRK